MNMRSVFSMLAVGTIAAVASGCGDSTSLADPALTELRVLETRALALSEEIETSGGVTDADRQAIHRLTADFEAWNARYDVADVVIGGRGALTGGDERLTSASVPWPPWPPGDPGTDCTYKCPDTTIEWENGYRKICFLVKSVCYTDGQLDCDYFCYYVPIFF